MICTKVAVLPASYCPASQLSHADCSSTNFSPASHDYHNYALLIVYRELLWLFDRCVTRPCQLSHPVCLFLNFSPASHDSHEVSSCSQLSACFPRFTTLGLFIFELFASRLHDCNCSLSQYPSVAIRRAGRLILVLSFFALFTLVFIISGYLSRGHDSQLS